MLCLWRAAGRHEQSSETGKGGGGGRGASLCLCCSTCGSCGSRRPVLYSLRFGALLLLPPAAFMWRRGVCFSASLRSLVLFLLLRLQSSLYPSPGSTPLLCFLITLSHTLLCVGVHYWAGVPLLASDWLAEGCALCIVRENKGGRGGTPAGWGQGRAEMECVGVFVLRWSGLKPAEERVSRSVGGTLSK